MDVKVENRTKYVTVYLIIKSLHISRDEIYKRVEEKLQARRERAQTADLTNSSDVENRKQRSERVDCEASYTERLRRVVEEKRKERRGGDRMEEVGRRGEIRERGLGEDLGRNKDDATAKRRKENVGRHKEDVATHKEDVARHKEDVARHKEDVGRRNDDARRRKDDVEKHKEDIEKHKNDVESHKENVGRKDVIEDILRREEERGKNSDEKSFGVSSAYELDDLKRKLKLTTELLEQSKRKKSINEPEKQRKDPSRYSPNRGMEKKRAVESRQNVEREEKRKRIVRQITLEPRVADFVSASEVSGSSLSSLSQELEEMRSSRREVKALTTKPTKDPPKYQPKNSRSAQKSDKKAMASTRPKAVGVERGFTDEEMELFEAEIKSYKEQINSVTSSLEEVLSQHTMSDISNPFSGSEPYHANISAELEHASRYLSSEEDYSLHSESISHDEAKSLLLSSERLYQHMLAASVHSDIAAKELAEDGSETELFEDDELPFIGKSGSSSEEIPQFTHEHSSSTRRMGDPVARHLQESDDSDLEETVIDDNDETLIIFGDDEEDNNFFVHETSPRFGKKVPKGSNTTKVSSGKKTAEKQSKSLTAKQPIVIPSKKVTPKPTETKKKVPNPRTVPPKPLPTKTSTKGLKTEVSSTKTPLPTAQTPPIVTKTPVAKSKSKPPVIEMTPTDSKTLTVKPGISSTLAVKQSKTSQRPVIPVKTTIKPNNVSEQRFNAKDELAKADVAAKPAKSPTATKTAKKHVAPAPKPAITKSPTTKSPEISRKPSVKSSSAATTAPSAASKSPKAQTNLNSKGLPIHARTPSAPVNSIKPAGHSRTVARRPSQEPVQPKIATGSSNPIATPDKFPVKKTVLDKTKPAKEIPTVLTKTLPPTPTTKPALSLSTRTNVTTKPSVSVSTEPVAKMKHVAKPAISPKSKEVSKPSSSSKLSPSSKSSPTPASKPTVATPTSTSIHNKTLSPAPNLKHLEYKPKSKTTSPKIESKLPTPKLSSKTPKPATAPKPTISAKPDPKSSLNKTLSPTASSKPSPVSKPDPAVAPKSRGSKPSPSSKQSPASKPATNTPTSTLNKTLSPNLKQMEYMAKVTTKTTSPKSDSKRPSPKISNNKETILEGQNASEEIVMKPQKVSANKDSKLPRR